MSLLSVVTLKNVPARQFRDMTLRDFNNDNCKNQLAKPKYEV